MNRRVILYEAAGVVDAAGVEAAPGSILMDWGDGANASRPLGGVVLAAGSPEEVRSRPEAAIALERLLPWSVLIPGLVNAHTHLDLTHMGPRPYDAKGGFPGWVAMIGRQRARTPESIAASVLLGAERSMAGGVVAAGDIAGVGSADAVAAMQESDLIGVSFLEFFGLGARQRESARSMNDLLASLETCRNGVRVGAQPHSPYAAGLDLYEAAVRLHRQIGSPVSTHLAEMPQERQCVAQAQGPIREMLEGLSVWDAEAEASFGKGLSPIAHLSPILRQAPMLLAHVNDADDADLDLLATTEASVVYCPRASAYFGHPTALGPHPYQRMIERGIPVALGTDSIINLPPEADGSTPVMSTLDEMRLLRRRDDADALSLLAMATIQGARALGLDPSLFTYSPGPIAGVAAVDVSPGTSELRPAERIVEEPGSIHLLLPPAAEDAIEAPEDRSA